VEKKMEKISGQFSLLKKMFEIFVETSESENYIFCDHATNECQKNISESITILIDSLQKLCEKYPTDINLAIKEEVDNIWDYIEDYYTL
jgi:hypothetical protein